MTEHAGVERPEVKLPGRRDHFGHGALLAVDLARVDRWWNELPVASLIEGIRAGTLAPAPPGAIPGVLPPSAPAETKGLDIAIAALAQLPKLATRPLAENLRARRTLKAPWKWFSTAPDAREELRADERLVRLAEITRLPDLSAEDVMIVGSVAERGMIGAKEVRGAFARWSSPGFGDALEKIPDADVEEILVDGWGSAVPLVAALGLDDESQLGDAVLSRVRAVRALVSFAREHRLSVLAWTKEGFPAWLQERATARAAGH